ncbi:MAG: DUF4369 domain-containing protein [Tenacibaculum sp.]|nr:DUF4369 domain-containing protein [Tenacibaculum sp.]
MKRIITILAISIITFSCSKEKGNMIVKGQIKGLKKGKLYLQKLKDTAIISVDSVELFNNNKFTLSDNVNSPVMYYLTFKGNLQERRIMFFGEKGKITINDNIQNFGFKPIIKGSKNQEVLEKFNKVNNKFKLQRLDFIAKDIEARTKKDFKTVKELEENYKKMVRRRFLYTTNFAITHKDSEVAPYIALSELFDANISLLDTINKSLSEKVKKSTYGKQLDKFINDVKSNEKQ